MPVETVIQFIEWLRQYLVGAVMGGECGVSGGKIAAFRKCMHTACCWNSRLLSSWGSPPHDNILLNFCLFVFHSLSAHLVWFENNKRPANISINGAPLKWLVNEKKFTSSISSTLYLNWLWQCGMRTQSSCNQSWDKPCGKMRKNP